MKVSVVIPVYNKGPFLKDCFDSVFGQSFADLEVIAVDDRSSDDSLERLRAMHDPRLRVVQMERNGGPAAAAQRGIDEAAGEYVVRVDADDINRPDRIARQVAFMDSHPEVVLSGGQLDLFGSESGRWSFPLTDAACKARLLFGSPVAQPASILRTAVLRQHNVRYEATWPRFGEDWLFWTRLSRFGAFANLDEPLIDYRRGEQNSSTGRDRIKDHELLFRMVFAELGLPGPGPDMELQLWTIRLFPHPPTSARVKDFRDWLDRLKQANTERGVLPVAAFNAEVERIWNGTFHYLADRGWAPALRHLALSGWDAARLSYLVKRRLLRTERRAR